MQFQPSQYSNYGGGWIPDWVPFVGTKEKATETAKMAVMGPAGYYISKSADETMEEAIARDEAVEAPSEPPAPAIPPPQTAPVPEDKPEKKKLTEQDWFWPTVIVVGSLGVAGAVLYLPKRS